MKNLLLMNQNQREKKMPRLAILFIVSILFSLIFQFVLGGDGSVNYHDTVINITLSDLLILALLLSNLIAVIFLIKRKR